MKNQSVDVAADRHSDEEGRLVSIHQAIAEVNAALDDPDGSYTAYKRYCEGLIALCDAYLAEYEASDGEPQIPFPDRAIQIWKKQLQVLLAGHLSPMATALVKRSGRRGFDLEDSSDIEWAVMFREAVKRGWIKHDSPVVWIAEQYGVERNTAQGWSRKYNGKTLLAEYEGARKEEFIAHICGAIERCGERRQQKHQRRKKA